MASDTWIRRLTAAAVLLVAAIAAVVSYEHLYHLAVTHCETRLDAALIPLSIDGTVVTGSLLMLHAMRLGLGTPRLGRAMLGASVLMTIAANVAFGWGAGAWGVLMAGWPAAAFLLNAEGSIGFGRKARQERKAGAPEDKDTAGPQPVIVPPAADIPGARPQRGGDTRTGQRARDKLDVLLDSHPDWTQAALAAQAMVSVKTVQRRIAARRQDRALAGYDPGQAVSERIAMASNGSGAHG